MPDYESNQEAATGGYTVVGTRPIRHDGPDKVTGRARYAADVFFAGLLHGKLLRSPHPHAAIKRIDITRAMALPGVKAVVTAADFPDASADVADQEAGANVNYGFYSRWVLAREKVLFRGHAVAAVAAISAPIAEEALGLIDVEYEVLPPALDAYEAMKEDAPILHDRLLTMGNPRYRLGGYGDNPDGKKSNVASHIEFRVGDTAEGFEEADAVAEREFHTKPVHQGYIEPHSATALWQSDDSVTIWCSTQGHFGLRDRTARLLGLSAAKVRIVPMEIGGGFGGKGLVGYLESVAAVLSRKSGQPVKLTMTRAEVFEGTGPTAGTHIKVKLGATKEGRLTAAECRLVYEAGAFPGSPVFAGCRTILMAYEIANAHIEGFDVVVNAPKATAYRAPGSPAAAFAVESVIDELCRQLSIDPVEFRLRNAAKEGTREPAGPVFRRIGFVEVLQAGKGHPHLTAPVGGPNRGRGVAAGAWYNDSGPASAVASVNPDGTVSLVEGSPDIGGSRAVMAMQLAEVLGISAEEVKPSVGDTDSIGFSSGAGGSGVTFKMGTACYEAGLDIRRQAVERAARIWEVDPADVEYDRGLIAHKSDPALSMTLKDLAPRLNGTGGAIVGRAAVNPGGVGNAFALHVVDVEVDPETGKVDVLRYTAIQDAGKAIHPGYVEGQIQGGAVQGIGWALNEEYYLNDQGHMMNSSFLDYRMPTSLDLPMVDAVIVEVANPGHPYGVRGVGEAPIVPPMAAIANAIYDAVGVRMTRLPMNPGSVLEALWEKG